HRVSRRRDATLVESHGRGKPCRRGMLFQIVVNLVAEIVDPPPVPLEREEIAALVPAQLFGRLRLGCQIAQAVPDIGIERALRLREISGGRWWRAGVRLAAQRLLIPGGGDRDDGQDADDDDGPDPTRCSSATCWVGSQG